MTTRCDFEVDDNILLHYLYKLYMNETRDRVLLIVSEGVLSQARVLAGRMTATLGLPVSLQVILRALIEEGLKQKDRRRLTGTIAAHANAVRAARRMARRGSGPEARRRRNGVGRLRAKK